MCTRNCFVSLLLLIACTFGYAQTKLPDFGKVDKSDLEMKECATDKTAPAMVLYDEGVIVFNWDESREDFEMERKVRTRIKVFSDKGLDYANVKIRFLSDDKYEQVSGISGNTFNLDEGGNIVTTKLSKDLIVKNKETDNMSSVTFSLPGVKVGTVFEYRYTITKKSFSKIAPWVFQERIPTRVSSFDIEMPEYFRFIPRLNLNGTSTLEKNSTDDSRNIFMGRNTVRMGVTRYHFLLKDVAAIHMEPYMSGYNDYLQSLTLQLSAFIVNGIEIRSYTTSWAKLAEELWEREIFGTQIKKRVSISGLDTELEKYTSKKDKIECIHRYVRDHFEWDGREDFYCVNVKKIADQRKGSTGDINILLLSLLRSNDIEAYPLLVSTREHGKILAEYPFLDQFNSLYVLVKDENGRHYVINAADKYNPTNLIPYDVMGTAAFLADKQNASIVDIWDGSMTEKNMISYMATLSEDGTMNGEVFISNSGYAKNPKLKALKKGNELYINEDLKGDMQNFTIEGFSVANTGVDSLNLEQRFKFKTRLQGSGEYVFFNPNLFTGLDKNPFVSEKRVSQIDFGYLRRTILNTQIVIPDNYEVEELPKVPGLLMADSSIFFRRTYTQAGNTIILRMSLDINRTIFDAEEYEDFREFYKKLFAMLNEQLVLKKKK